MGNSDLVDVTVKMHAKTERAILISDGGEAENAVWVPLSQCEVLPLTKGMVTVTMPEWLAMDKGLI